MSEAVAFGVHSKGVTHGGVKTFVAGGGRMHGGHVALLLSAKVEGPLYRPVRRANRCEVMQTVGRDFGFSRVSHPAKVAEA